MTQKNNPHIYWHADDIGLSAGITQSIQACFDTINSVSVVVNGTDLSGAVSVIQAYDKKHSKNPMRVVLHLNFMEGEALSGKSVICPSGVFNKGFIKFWVHAVKNRFDKIGFEDAIYAETLHQIKAFKQAFGYIPTHVDCHQHMHMIPIVAQAVARALHESGIPHIRIPKDCIWVRSNIINTVKYSLLRILSFITKKIWEKHDITASVAFFGVLPTGTANADIYLPALQWQQAQQGQHIPPEHIPPLEILFHPGKALPPEFKQWQHRPDLWTYYNSPVRDNEAHVLSTLYTYINKA